MKKTILFALSALLVGACAKEDPEEKEIFPDVPPRGFHLDKRPFYLLESTYDAVAFSRSDLKITQVGQEKRFALEYRIAYKGHTAEGNETVLFVERILPGLYYKGAKIEPRVSYALANQRLVISLSDPNNMDNAFTLELSQAHLGKLLPLDKVDTQENYWSIQLPGSRYEGKAGHLAPAGSWMRVTPIGDRYKLLFFINNDFKGNL